MTRAPVPTAGGRLHGSTFTLLLLLAALGSLTVDFYMPALPELQRDLGASTAAAQLTLTATTIGFALGQLLIGSWSDSVGRRRPLLMAAGVHAASSAAIAVAPSIGWVLGLRLIQGVGAAGCAVAATAIVRDLVSGRDFIATIARVSVVSGLTPVVAPLAAAQLQQVMSWRALFVLVAGYGFAMAVLTLWVLPESLPPARRLGIRPREVAARYVALARDRQFVGAALIGGLGVSGVFAMMTSSSFLLQGTMGLDSRGYSVAFAVNAIAFVVGTQASARIVQRTPPRRILRVCLPLLALVGFATIVAAGLGPVGLTMATASFMVCAGMIMPCLQVLALADHGHQAGTAAAFLGAANFALAGVTSPLVGALGVGSAGPMGLVMGGAGTLACLVLVVLVGKGHDSPPDGSGVSD